jgi:hypothetical protein
VDMFYQTFGFIAAVCAGIIIIAMFFTALNFFKRLFRGNRTVTAKGFLREGKQINVYLTSGRTVQNVRFIGFTDPSSAKSGGIPYQLSSMAVFESMRGTRTLVRADAIKMIEEVEEPYPTEDGKP